MNFTPYLNFNGDCAEAFRTYQRIIGGELELMTHGDSPMADQTPPESRDRIMHARLVIGDAVLMASDAPPEYYQKPQGNYVSLGVGEPAEAERIFRELSEGGTVQMPFEKTFWASGGFGMFVDRFGIPWMVNCEPGDKHLR